MQIYQNPNPAPFPVSPQANNASAFNENMIAVYLQNAGLAVKREQNNQIRLYSHKFDANQLETTKRIQQ